MMRIVRIKVLRIRRFIRIHRLGRRRHGSVVAIIALRIVNHTFIILIISLILFISIFFPSA